MNASTTLFRFRFDLSDVDRGVYETVDFRLAKHPSETATYLLTRAFAYALNFQEGLEFSGAGLGDPDAPSISLKHPNGRMLLWIEIGNPSAKKLHRAAKSAEKVLVYTYKDARLLVREALAERVHRAEEIEIFALDPNFLERLAKDLPKDIRWQVLVNEGGLTINGATTSDQTEIVKYEIREA